MKETELLPHLFRTEYRKLVSVLCATFGMAHVETAEDIVSDTFLQATETWGMKGIPENPVAWLYTVAKNKTRNYLKRGTLFDQKIAPELQRGDMLTREPEIDLSPQHIRDSQLAMIFAVCHPSLSAESQIALALNLLCGFGVPEIADAFLSNKETVYKRLNRAKEKLKTEKPDIAPPTPAQINERLNAVLTTLYLLFSEGYYSTSQNTVLRKELCAEAMHLTYLLTENPLSDLPAVNALLSLMSFHASRFEARTDEHGETVLYDDQDTNRWDPQLIEQGTYLLTKASQGNTLSKYHLEAAIAYWHTHKEDSPEKWENILQLYNRLLLSEYSPMAALNRTYALAKANGKTQAIAEAEKLGLADNPFYHSLLGHLYTDIDNKKALRHFEHARELTASAAEKSTLNKKIEGLKNR